MTDQVIYDRGYRPYRGPLTGTAGARRAVYKEGLRRPLGLGRKARMKIFPWTLLSIALIAAAVFVGLHWAIGNIDESFRQGIPSYGGLFDFYSAIALLFIAFTGPLLLVPDRTSGALSIYFSRPLTVDGYLAAKAAAFATVVGAIYLVPQIVLHLGLSLISSDGFLPYLGSTLDVLWKVPLTALGFIVLHGSVVFALAAVINRSGLAAAGFLGILTVGRGIAGRISEAPFPGARWFSLLDLGQHPRIIRDYLFADTVDYPAEVAGFEVWVSAVAIAVIAVASLWFVRRIYRRLA